MDSMQRDIRLEGAIQLKERSIDRLVGLVSVLLVGRLGGSSSIVVSDFNL